MKGAIWKTGFNILLLTVFFNINVQAAISTRTEAELKNIFIPILCYHRIVPNPSSIYDLSPEILEKQIRFILNQGFQPITALQYLKLQQYPQHFPYKPVIFTFDDGTKGHFQYVFPLLQKYRIKATFFVYPGNIAKHSDHQLTWTELKKMARAGMDIESHTWSHPFLTKTGRKSPDDSGYLTWLDQELKDSRLILEKQLQTKVNILAYSYGWFNNIVETKALEAGYQGIFTVNWGVNRTDENPLRLKRRVVSNRLSEAELQSYLNSKPLSLEIISPPDAAIIGQVPVIKFKLAGRELMLTDLVMGKNKSVLKPDPEGAFTASFKKINTGYNMVIISGYNDRHQLCISSWGFDYQPETALGVNTLKTK